jgi:O-antigen/teichoic acid export membrane protein
LSTIKKLAGQTFWYGVPTIASRFLAYATNILLFWLYKPASTSFITQVYAIIPFLNILFTYGLETSYFRFLQTEDKKKLYNSLTVCLLFTTLLFTGILFWQASAIANLVEMHEHSEYIQWVGWIMLFDTLAVLPFAKLRQENRPKYFAFIKTINILINVLLTVFFLGIIWILVLVIISLPI